MRILITASRNWEGPEAERKIHEVLSAAHALATALGSPLTVVHGDCPTGGDAIADRWARRRDSDGVIVEPYAAQWGIFGKPAGFIRNQAMVDEGADMCIAFIRDNSKGATDCLSRAWEAQIPGFVVNWEDLWRS
jgi:YspA, cpYpsA-related SLOG family